jgi:hypothetical protein
MPDPDNFTPRAIRTSIRVHGEHPCLQVRLLLPAAAG